MIQNDFRSLGRFYRVSITVGKFSQLLPSQMLTFRMLTAQMLTVQSLTSTVVVTVFSACNSNDDIVCIFSQ